MGKGLHEALFRGRRPKRLVLAWELIGKYWQAIEWDLRPDNAFEYFLIYPGRFGRGRYASRRGRTLSQFLRNCDTLSRIQGGFLWAEMQSDPEVVEQMAKLLDGKPSKPPLFGWTAVIDRLTNIGDQLIAQRANDPSKAEFYPRPVIPVLKHRKESELSEIDNDILASQQRYTERNTAVQQLNK